jgi:hypothetical protein
MFVESIAALSQEISGGIYSPNFAKLPNP